MELSAFLDVLFTSETWYNHSSVMWFIYTNEYPLYFFSLIRTYHKKTSMPVTFIPSGYVAHTIQEQISISFLGMKQLYFISPHAASLNDRKNILNFLISYTGPHTIICPIQDSERTLDQSQNAIIVPEQCTLDIVKKLSHFFVRDISSDNDAFFEYIFSRYKEHALDTLLMLLNYYHVVGKNSKQFLTAYMSKIVGAQPSLYALSQAFFARDPRKLFRLWSEIRFHFVPPFWISFWSEQIWRAAVYCSYMKVNDRMNAKKIGYRLPYTFLNNDWRFHQSDHLLRIHAYLCAMDSTIKQGNSYVPFEQLFAKYLLNDFEKNPSVSTTVQVV